MNLYEMMNGKNPSCFIFLPMLGKKMEEYPRFRDCFITDGDNGILILTRTGGGNREGYLVENESIRTHPNFILDYDDDYDCTYAYWKFSIPEKWKVDFNLIGEGRITKTSNEYKALIKEFYPTIYDRLFNTETNEQ